MRSGEFRKIADIIRTLPKAFGLRNTVAKHFADRLKAEYQRFDTKQFLEACGFTEESDEE